MIRMFIRILNCIMYRSRISKNISYEKGICPIAERLHDETLIMFQVCLFEFSNSDIDLIIKAFKKVWVDIELLN